MFALRRLPLLVFALTIILTVLTGVMGQERKLKDLPWSHAFDLASRKYGQTEINKDTKRYGVEAFRDDNTGFGLYVSQVGSMAIAPNFKDLTVPVADSKGPSWLTGLDLPARKAGEKEFTKTTKVHSLEVFRDPNVDDWLFITDKGNIAATTAKLFPGVANKNPKWVHSVDLQVRKGGVKEWKDAAKIGIEVYRDGNTANLIYITEDGQIAIIPETTEVEVREGKGKAPEWLHGLDLSCRKFDEKSFSPSTRKFGVEVYNDLTTGNLIFISETGSIAVMPAPAGVKAPTINTKEPQWTHGLNVKCREYGEKDFSEKTRTFGAEVFRDENIGATIYVNELGAIAAMPTK
jgi:hypothetical protein